MLSNLPIPYDLCVGDPISCLLTVGCGVNGLNSVLNEMNENSSSRFQPGKPSFEALLHYTWHVSRGRCTRWRCSTAASRTCSWARSARTCWPPWSGERGGWRGGPCRGPAVSRVPGAALLPGHRSQFVPFVFWPRYTAEVIQCLQTWGL